MGEDHTHTIKVFWHIIQNSKYPVKKQFENFVEKQHKGWVSDEFKTLLKFGVIKKWEDCGEDSKSPHKIARLQVEQQKVNKRLIYNAKYLNCFKDSPKFSLEGVQKISHFEWKGMFMISIDHKTEYFHCGLHKSSWTHFDFAWEGIMYVYISLCFGWSPAAFIYVNFT